VETGTILSSDRAVVGLDHSTTLTQRKRSMSLRETLQGLREKQT
jgi:hypothetical protein